MDIGAVYLIVSFSWTRWPIYKVGKSTLRRRRRRAQEIDKSVRRSREVAIAFTPALYPFKLERRIRARLLRWKYTYRGSGKTEYYRPQVPVLDDLRILSKVLLIFALYWALAIVLLSCTVLGGWVLVLALFQ